MSAGTPHGQAGSRLSPLRAIFVILAPALLALLTALYIGRPSIVFLAGCVVLAAAVLACDAWIIVRREWISAGLGLMSHAAFLIFVGGYAAAPFAAPAPLADPLPPASPPNGMTMYALPTGVKPPHVCFRLPRWLALGEMGLRDDRSPGATSPGRRANRHGCRPNDRVAAQPTRSRPRRGSSPTTTASRAATAKSSRRRVKSAF